MKNKNDPGHSELTYDCSEWDFQLVLNYRGKNQSYVKFFHVLYNCKFKQDTNLLTQD